MSDTDRLKKAIETIVRSITRNTLWLARYPVRIVAQGATRLLEIDVDTDPKTGRKKVPDQIGVPIRPGLPGFRVKVPAGVRGTLAYEHGSGRVPVVVSWEEGDAVDELKFADGTKGAARTDDEVNPGSLTFAASSTAKTLTITYTPPTGLGAPTTVVFGGFASISDLTPVVVALKAKITGGSTKFKIGG